MNGLVTLVSFHQGSAGYLNEHVTIPFSVRHCVSFRLISRKQ